MNHEAEVRARLESIYRAESRRVLATLIRLLGDFDLAEEALHDAFAAAIEQWPRDGVPANPRAWLVSTGRFKAIDRIRRRRRFDARSTTSWPSSCRPRDPSDPRPWTTRTLEDDRLRLIFTCCHPALAPDAQVALTLREVCGLTTEEIARAFLDRRRRRSRSASCARRARSAMARIPYEVPERDRAAGAARRRAARRLPRVQRGLLGVVRRVADARTISRPRRSGSAGCSSSCCPSPRRSGCWRSCCCTNRGAPRAARRRASWCCSTSRIARSGTAR